MVRGREDKPTKRCGLGVRPGPSWPSAAGAADGRIGRVSACRSPDSDLETGWYDVSVLLRDEPGYGPCLAG